MPSPSTTKVLLLFVCVFLIVSCASPTSDPVRPTDTVVPSATIPPPTDTPLPTESPTPTAVPQPALARPQYAIDLQFNFTTQIATVNQTITYPNWSGETLNSVVLAVEPNLWNGGFTIKSLEVDGQPVANYTLEGQKLDVPLPQPLPPGSIISISMNYGLVLPQMQAYTNPDDVRPQIYGYSDRQTNFVDWYPMVVPYNPGEGWVLYNPWYYGEHLVYDLADFDVTITFTDGAMPLIASSGAEVDSGKSGTRRYVLEAGRSFALSMGLYYKIATQTVGDVTVYSYFFAFYDAAGKALLQTTVEALQVFNEKLGPYHHKTLTAVQGDFNDGMEFSGFYFISRDYFNLYQADPVKNYLIIIAAHETAHQWWFDSVGNNQAIEPWLDEALATYSERIYYETVHPDLVKWWWGYRYFEFQKAGFVDTSIYDGEGQRPYWDKVYLTGARFLEDLRTQIGDETFFAFLKDYYTQFEGRRATSADFFRVLREHTSADISDLMTKYFKNPY
ncbi:MAG TPA: M1 family metallopeptidase [Anaerolineales bacterium]|nr:M1 family metallopeptidase [Anaerolineales bacterium]